MYGGKLVKQIKLGLKNLYVLVDDEDYEYLNQFQWQDNGVGYAKRHLPKVNGKRKDLLMSREIMKATGALQVDHIDRNPLNNQKNNLRLATQTQNHINTNKKPSNTSGYKGVYLEKYCYSKNGKQYLRKSNPWVAQIKIDKKATRLGSFATPKDAARAYNLKALEVYGEFARLNQI